MALCAAVPPPSDNAPSDGQTEHRFETPDGTVVVRERPDGQREVRVSPSSSSRIFVARDSCVTSYPVDLIEVVLQTKGLGWVCDEIAREEHPGYLQNVLWWTVRPNMSDDELRGRRVLDFGCGSGASTMILARLFADTEFVGVDIDESALRVAEGRRRHYGLGNITFRRSTDPNGVPDDLGVFDAVVFSAVLEHLLPAERLIIIPAVWSRVKPGGVLLVGETPHRFSPVETHTTGGLPLINYLPSRATLWAARRFSPKVSPESSWEELLRGGIRGGSEREFLRALRDAGVHDATIRRPLPSSGVRDEFDLWYRMSSVNELPGFKRWLERSFRVIKRVTGVSFTPYLSFAVEKDRAR